MSSDYNSEEYFVEQRDKAREKVMGFIGLKYLSNIELVELNSILRECIDQEKSEASPRSQFEPAVEAAVRFCKKNYGYDPSDPKERKSLLGMRREEKSETGRDTFEYFRRKQDRDHML